MLLDSKFFCPRLLSHNRFLVQCLGTYQEFQRKMEIGPQEKERERESQNGSLGNLDITDAEKQTKEIFDS